MARKFKVAVFDQLWLLWLSFEGHPEGRSGSVVHELPDRCLRCRHRRTRHTLQ